MTQDRKPRETPIAAQAFAEYVALGPSRSLAKLAEQRVHQGLAKNIPSALTLLKKWSAAHDWQTRLVDAVNERTSRLLAEAAELDSETFLATSREYRRRTSPAMIAAMQLNDMHPVRDRVKSLAAKAPAFTISITIQQEAERLAAELGIPSADLLKQAEAIAAAAWGDDS